MSSDKTRLSIASAVELAIELADGTAPVGKVSLRVTDIDLLIARLAQLRSTMMPEIDRAPPETVETGALLDPVWAVRIPHTGKERLFMLRHPGIGWLSVLLPAAEAARLGHLLLAGLPHHLEHEQASDRPLH